MVAANIWPAFLKSPLYRKRDRYAYRKINMDR
jgi:hypothetical protein